MNTTKYIQDADYTAESLYRDIRSRIDAHSYVSQDDLDAYYRAEDTLKQQETLWRDRTGLLTDHDHVWDGAE